MQKKTLILSWIILVSLSVIWGSSFILIKKGLIYFSSNEVGALRIVIAFIFLLPFVIPRIKTLKKRDWFWIGVIGLIGSGIPPFLFAEAQTVMDSYMAGILNSLTPLSTFIIGLSFFKAKTRLINIIGIIVGLAGAVGLIIAQSGVNLAFHAGYAALVVLATICYATNVNLVKYYLKDVNAVTITAFSFFIIGGPAAIYLFFGTDFIHTLTQKPESWNGLIYLAILAIVGTGIALIAFNKLVKMASPLFAASVTYLIPIFAMIWGVIDHEVLKFEYLLWVAVILIGIVMVNKRVP